MRRSRLFQKKKTKKERQVGKIKAKADGDLPPGEKV